MYEYDPKRVVYFAATDSRNSRIPFGIKAEDRMRHMYVIGKTGMGKSTLLENMAIQDIQNGEGMCFIDPHGGTAEKLLEFVPESRIKDVVYFAPFDTEYPLGFNVMEDVGYDKRHLVVAGLMSSFQRIWVDSWSARMEYFLQNTLFALLEYPDSTLIDVNRMLINKDFRNKVIEYITDPIIKRFWVEEFAGYSDKYTQEATPAIQNKIGQFASNPLVRNIIAQPKSTFDIRKMMDENKIFIVNLSKGRMGEQNADLLGSMLVTKMYLAAMSRAEESPQDLAKLPPFYLYVDEFQSVVNDSFANILSEARKYKLSLTIAHQYIEQVEENIRAAVFGNVGTTITFRVGPFDAETLKTIFEPTFFAEDIVNLGRFQIFLTLMIDSMGSKPFSATTLPAVEDPPKSYVNEVIEASRMQFSRSRAEVEKLLSSVDEALPAGGFDKKDKYKPGGSTKGDARKVKDRPVDTLRPLTLGNKKEPTKSAAQNTQKSERQRSTTARTTEKNEGSKEAKKDDTHKQQAHISKKRELSKPRASHKQSEEEIQNRNALRDALANLAPQAKKEQPKKESRAAKNSTDKNTPASTRVYGYTKQRSTSRDGSVPEVPRETLDRVLGGDAQ